MAFRTRSLFILATIPSTARIASSIHQYIAQHGEQASYNEKSDSSYPPACGLIALPPSLTSDTSVVIVQGTSTAGTEAAADFLFDDKRFEEFLRRSAAGAKGAPFFEVLLQAEKVGGAAQRASVIESRVLSQSSP